MVPVTRSIPQGFPGEFLGSPDHVTYRLQVAPGTSERDALAKTSEMTSGRPVPSWVPVLLGVIYFLFLLYLFFASIELLSLAFKMAGRGFAERLIAMVSDPVAGLLLGFVATAIIQSSSTTTTIVVGLVASGALSIELAVPVIMGANLGTTITAILASFSTGSPAAVTVALAHLAFNLMGIAIFYPLGAPSPGHPPYPSASLWARSRAAPPGKRNATSIPRAASPAMTT